MSTSYRVILGRKYLFMFFKLIRESDSFVSWAKLRKDLVIGDTALKRYKRGELTIPLLLFLTLLGYLNKKDHKLFTQNVSLRNSNWGAKKGAHAAISKLSKTKLNENMSKVRSNIKRKNILDTPYPTLFDLSACEFFGAMLGDGCVSYFKNEGQIKSEVRIVGNAKKDRIYLEYISGLIKKLFNSQAKVYERKKDNSLQLCTRKKSVAAWLKNNGYPTGKKPKDFGIPENLMNLPLDYLNRVIRGLLDTDGHVNARKDENYKYPYITISSVSHNLKNQLKVILRRQGFPAFIHSDAVSIRGAKNFHKWFEVVGSSNPRILKKYDEFCNIGQIIPGSW
ncbi:MAG: LAGLIDADG family homing endonuclease [archaeon]